MARLSEYLLYDLLVTLLYQQLIQVYRNYCLRGLVMATQQIVDGPQCVGSQMLWLAQKTCVTGREMWAQDFDRTGINIVRSDQNIENQYFKENYHFFKR